MFGIEFSDTLRFLMQASAGFAGAASLWGFVVSKWIKKDEFVKILFIASLAGAFIFLSLWIVSFIFLFPPIASAHEGIVIKYSYDQLRAGFEFNLPFVIFLAVISILGLIVFLKKKLNTKYLPYFFLLQFLTISIILCFGILTGRLDRDQLFFFFHNWHSILTLGTVMTVDILYLLSLRKDDLKRVIYPFFPFMSAAIWIGLGIDFVSVFFIIEEAFNVNAQFLFNQTVVAIIIINGALLSGKINDKLLSFIKPDRVDRPSKKENLIFGISGSVSIVSWLTITFLDFVDLTVSYPAMFITWALIIAIAFFTQKIIEEKIILKSA